MALFAIGDPHLSLGGNKSMEVFSGWQDYVTRLETNWRRAVTPQDTVLLAGDISWAMKLQQCDADFAFLHGLPGQKIIMKGNHDFWWSTVAKMNSYCEEKGFTSIKFLFNNSYLVEGMALCGTRSWLFEAGEPNDEKVQAREAGRLIASLEAAKAFPQAEKVVFLHYPPVYTNANAPQMIEIMQRYGVRRCYYAHLHSGAIRWAVQGEIEGITYKLISADALEFMPLRIDAPQ